MKRSWHAYTFLFIILLWLDRVIKMWVMGSGSQPWQITSWFSISRLLNRGISFSLLSFETGHYYAFVSLVVSLMCLALFWYTYRRWRAGYAVMAETIVLAGACSNLIDRVWYGGVVDFIELSYGTWAWPAFNLADILIVCGLLIMCIKGLYEE